MMSRSGQSLLELLIVLSIAAFAAAGVSGTTALIMRSNVQVKRLQTATGLSGALFDTVRAFAESDWHRLLDLSPGAASHYYLNTASAPFTAVAGDETVTLESVEYTRYFYVEPVNRALCGAGDITQSATTTCSTGPGSAGVAEDSSTEKVTVITTWPDTTTGVTLVGYLARTDNAVLRQTDWSGGAGQESFPTPSDTNNLFTSASDADVTSTPGSIKVVLP